MKIMNLNEEISRIKEVMGIPQVGYLKEDHNFGLTEVENLLIEFYNQLEFQKKVFIGILNTMSDGEKYSSIKKLQIEQVNYLFSKDNLILESYRIMFPKFIISENKFNFVDDITKFNEFLFSSICQKIGFIKENTLKWVKKKYKLLQEQRISDLPQNQQTGPTPNLGPAPKPKSLYSTLTPQQQQQYKDSQKGQTNLAKQYNSKKTEQSTSVVDYLKSAVDYITKNGISTIMEGLRSALLSVRGAAVQTVLAFTGVGAIANDVAWGMLTLYDAYQYFFNGSDGKYLMNLIIDIFCLVTAGSLGPVLGKYVGQTASSVTNVIKTLMEGSVGNYIKPVLNVIKSGGEILSKFLGEASTFMSKNMGIKWVANAIGNVKSLFNTIVTSIGDIVGSVAGEAVNLIQRAGVQLFDRYSSTVAQGFSKLSPQQIESWVGRTVTETQLKAAEKLAEDNLKNKPTEEVLNLIDKQLGTHVADLFAIYLNTKKAAGYTKTLESGDLDKVAQNVGADVLQFKDPTEKMKKYSQNAQQAVTSINKSF
jgi:hypothetical protein